MTQIISCGCKRCSLSNHFDRVLAGIAHRGSSFSDFDDITHKIAHNGHADRFLVMEFKRPERRIERGQEWMLHALAMIPQFTVWVVVYRDDETLGFTEMLRNHTTPPLQVISNAEYRERYRCWWEGQQFAKEKHR